MQFTLATLAALAAASAVSAQTSAGSPPAGCSTSHSGTFEITVSLPMKKREIESRQTTCSSGALVATLSNSVLTDSKGRIGGIVANHQFQFDGPPSQAGTIFNSGWSVCSNGSLALGPSAIFYQCLSGSFYNLYNTPAGASCEAVIITVIPCSGSASGGASQGSDGQPTVASAVTQATEGQIQASSAASAPPKVTQITDGQVQASSAVQPVSQFTDGQIQVTASPVKATPVTQISDGQVQATSAVKPVTQISDGQVQATSAVEPVTQISDGQIQNSATVTAPPVSEATEGQPQVTATATSAAAPVSEATEGQPQVTANATKASTTPTPTTSPIVATGLAPAMTAGAQVVLAIAGFVAIAML